MLRPGKYHPEMAIPEMAREEPSGRYRSYGKNDISLIRRRDISQGMGFVRVHGFEVAVLPARQRRLTIYNGAKLVTIEAGILSFRQC